MKTLRQEIDERARLAACSLLDLGRIRGGDQGVTGGSVPVPQ